VQAALAKLERYYLSDGQGTDPFVGMWVLSMFATPYGPLLWSLPRGTSRGFIEEVLVELSDRYSTRIVHALGETVGDPVLGSKH
jgi:hypothetical protein